MILRVGAFLYRVHFVDEPIYHAGERCLGLCDNEAHEIFVSTQTSFAQQVHIVCHEYMEAWFYHFGRPRTESASPTDQHAAHAAKEHDCDLFGMAMAQFVMDLMHQLDQLGAAVPENPPEPATSPEHAPADPAIATKLADAAARAGLSVRRVHEPTPTPR